MSSVVVFRSTVVPDVTATWHKGGGYTVERGGKVVGRNYASADRAIDAAKRRARRIWQDELSLVVIPVDGVTILGITYAGTDNRLRTSKEFARLLIQQGKATEAP